MVASLAEITEGRKYEAKEVQRVQSLTGSYMITHKSYANPGGGTVAVMISTETGDGGGSLKLTATDRALRAVIGRGFRLPALSIYFSAATGVPCVAFMGNAAGNAEYTIFMGPKTGQHNPQTGTAPGLVGGVGASGERGVADQMYDGTNRWFGNPKRHAHATCVMVHEIGHVLHDVASPGQFWDYKKGRAAAGWLAHASDVSHYATKNPLEMVAETFCGSILGKTYPGGVGVAYANLGGAMPVAGAFP